MKKTFLPFALFTLLLTACCKDGDGLLWLDLLLPDGVATPCDSSRATPYHSSYTGQGNLSNLRLSDGYQVLTVSLDSLFWSDLRSGALLYSIASPAAGKAFSYADAIYRHGDLAIASSSTKLTAINLKTGKLAWERTLGDCAIDKGVFGVGDQYFVTRKIREADGVSAHALFVGDLHDADRLDMLFTPAYSRDTHAWAGYGWITEVAAFAGEDGHSYILTAFFETQKGTIAIANFVGLYDVTARSWVYERRPVFGRSANTHTSIRHMVINGTSAYFTLENKLIHWNLAAGNLVDSVLLFDKNKDVSPHAISYVTAEALWANDQQVIVQTSGDVQFFAQADLAPLYRLDCGAVRTDFDLDRLFAFSGGAMEVYKLSTGEKLSTIMPPCEGFTRNIATWKGSHDRIELSIVGRANNIYRYVLAAN